MHHQFKIISVTETFLQGPVITIVHLQQQHQDATEEADGFSLSKLADPWVLPTDPHASLRLQVTNTGCVLCPGLEEDLWNQTGLGLSLLS